MELLVALVILGTLSGGIGLALSTGLDANERVRRDGDRAQEVRIVLEALRADVLQAAFTAASERSWFVSTDEADGEREVDALRLITRSHRVPLRRFPLFSTGWESQAHDADWSAVTYSLTPAGGSEEGGLFRREQIPPGTDPFEEIGTDERLSEAVTALNIRCFDGEEWQDSWDTTADTNLGLPRAVEVTLTLHGGEAAPEGSSVTAAFPIRVTAAAEGERSRGGRW